MLRNSSGQVYSSGSITFNDTEGQEYISVTSSHGHDMTFTGQTSMFFSPTNDQRKVGGNGFDDVQGHRTTYTKRNHHVVANGTYMVMAGSPRLYDKNDKTLSDYVNIRTELAAVKCAPYLAVGGTTNNGGVVYEEKGSVNKESGSTEGGSFSELNIRQKYGDVVLSKASAMNKLEQRMGEGGDMIFTAAKDILISSGCAALPLPSGYINPKGRTIDKGYKIDSSKDKGQRAVPVTTATPSFEEKDTYSTIPFGKVNIVGSNKVSIQTGPGGFEVTGIGQVKLVGTGLAHLAGRQVNIVSGGTTNLNSSGAILATAPNFNVNSPDTVFAGNVNIKDNVIIGGDLEVAGDLLVYGKIIANGDIVAGGEGGISLLNHIHGGVEAGGGKTAPPE